MITILTSAVGLGLYIPALLIQRQLQARSLAVDIEVLETYYRPHYQAAHAEQRAAHHASFALAQIAHRMARSVDHCLDEPRVQQLLARWKAEQRQHFIVWAGFWLPVLKRYDDMLGAGLLRVDRCRIDAVVSASFKVHAELDSLGREIWLWNGRERRIEHEIGVGDASPIPFAAREDRLVVHGGGWGIGTYRATVPELAQTRYALDVVIHAASEGPPLRPGDRALMLDPAWHALDRGSADLPRFPPMVEMAGEAILRRLDSVDYHSMHDVIRASKAIVSKPGGGTLIDSLAAATPVVMLEPYGYAEEANARIWEHLGFGISFDAWRRTGYDSALLAQLHANIVARPRGIDYPSAYADAILETCE